MVSDEPLPRPFGAYLLLERLAAGGMGALHLARPISPVDGSSLLVVKQLAGAFERSDEGLARFQHEAEIAVSVESPHVVRVIDVGAVGDRPFIAMEYLLGATLGAILRACDESKRALPAPILARIFADALDGLEALHGAVHPETAVPLGAVHRDVSPGNVMVAADDGRCVLIDLGLGRSNVQRWRTQTGMLMGTPGYMAPEQARGERTDARTDLYALAVLLWEALMLERYVPREETPAMLARMRAPALRPLTGRAPALAAVLQRALSPEPAERFESAAELSRALLAAQPAASRREVLSAMPEGLVSGWRRQQARIDRLRHGAAELAPEPEKTTIYARRAAITAPLPTRPLEPRRARWRVPVLFLLVLLAAAVMTVRSLEAPEPPDSQDPPTAVIPQPEVRSRAVLVEQRTEAPAPAIDPTPERRAALKRRTTEVRMAPASPPAPPRPRPSSMPEADLRGQLSTLARRLRSHDPTDPRAGALLVRINRMLLLPSLEGRDRDVIELTAEADRIDPH